MLWSRTFPLIRHLHMHIFKVLRYIVDFKHRNEITMDFLFGHGKRSACFAILQSLSALLYASILKSSTCLEARCIEIKTAQCHMETVTLHCCVAGFML